MDKDSFIKLGREEIYNGKIVKLVKDKVKLPNNKETYFELVQHNGAAAIVPVDKRGKIILVEQFRNAANGLTLEIPAGTLEKDEDPLVCAKRELEEETGFTSENLTFLIKFYTSIGFCDEVIHVYIANDLQESQQNLDEDEFVNLKTYSLEEITKMIFDGTIVDSKTISAILAYKNYINEKNVIKIPSL
ncbi:ADP-ribose pyrophosphatase [Natranaerovirga pectinivora]|uniref:ADP-ribose pyrophosphatase n=1 Tax=Natranaerovirga pectinivora TaxID=682400 RepID=A0A4R3MLP6_9FIRM|nr:NUDIX hydrolase [Natranaerovirga pectinivora]TCT15024.1 ADP-ribose pyrophosphatase [Natranaerovirga pectinivora]